MHLIFLLLLLTFLMMILFSNPFLRAQKSGWYPFLLKPVVDQLSGNEQYRRMLDIGSGPGTLLGMLYRKDPELSLAGVDSNLAMVEMALANHAAYNISFQQVPVNQQLPFSVSEFDAICFCSVLYLMDERNTRNLMQEALSLLKKEGMIIVLTPTGNRPFVSSFVDVWKYPFSFDNWTYFIWKVLTGRPARNWQTNNWLSNFASNQRLQYQSKLVFDEHATIEILQFPIH